MVRQVQLSDDAYARLRALKRRGESFSDVVLRATGPAKDPRSFHGLGLLRAGFDPSEGPA